MATYYIQFEAVPTESNEHYSLVDGALVNCWVLAGDPQSALSIANFHVAKHGWLIEKTKTLPVVTTRTNFLDKDLGLKNYDKAQEDGVSVVYITVLKKAGDVYIMILGKDVIRLSMLIPYKKWAF